MPLLFQVFVIHSIAPYKEIQDRFGFWILRRGLWILGTRWDLDSRFLELNSVFQNPGFQIPQAQISRFPESEHRANPTSGDVSMYHQGNEREADSFIVRPEPALDMRSSCFKVFG